MYHCQTSTGWYLHSDCKFPRLVSHWQQAAPLAVFFDSLSNNFLKTCLLSTIFCDAFCISVCVFSACIYQCQTSTGWYLHTVCKFAHLVSHWQQAASLAVFFDNLSDNFFKTCLLSTFFCDAFCISVSVFSVCTYQCQTSTGWYWYLHTDCKFARPVSHWQQVAPLAVFFDNLSNNFLKTCILTVISAMLSAYLSVFFQHVSTSVRLRLAGTFILIVNLLVSLVTDNKLHHYPFFYKLSKHFFKVCFLSTIFCDAFCISVSVFSVCTYQCQTLTGWYLHTDCKFARPISHWQQAASLAVFFDNFSINFLKTCLLSVISAMLSAYLSVFFQHVCTSVRLRLAGTCIPIVNLLVSLDTDNKLHH